MNPAAHGWVYTHLQAYFGSYNTVSVLSDISQALGSTHLLYPAPVSQSIIERAHKGPVIVYDDDKERTGYTSTYHHI